MKIFWLICIFFIILIGYKVAIVLWPIDPGLVVANFAWLGIAILFYIERLIE